MDIFSLWEDVGKAIEKSITNSDLATLQSFIVGDDELFRYTVSQAVL
jgi:hypothetical protein